MSDQIEKAVFGAIAGSTLGAPLKGRKGFARLAFYEPIPQRMAASPALDAWVVMCRHCRPEYGPTSVPRLLTSHWAYLDDAAAFARANTSRSLIAPATGSFGNPLGGSAAAIGRALFWGVVWSGRPEEAARWASFDASYDHSEEGVWVARALAMAVASVEPGSSIVTIIRAVTSALPPESKAHHAVKCVLQTMAQPDAVRVVVEQVRTELAIADPNDAVLALTIVLAALGNSNDAPSALCAAVGCGGPTDQTGMAVGVLSAIARNGLPTDWLAPLGENYVAGHGLRETDPPGTIADIVGLVRATRLLFIGPEEKIEEDSANMTEAIAAIPDEETEPAEGDAAALSGGAAVPEVPPSLPIQPGLPSSPLSLAWDLGDLRVEFEYISGPAAIPGKSWNAALSFKNSSPLPIQVQTSLDAPQGWTFATRMSSFQLEPGAHAMHGVVFQPGSSDGNEMIKLKVNDRTLDIAVLKPQKWYVAGPFANDDATAFTKEAPPERKLNRSEPYAGRSGLAVRWTSLLVPGRSLAVEPFFASGPGVVVLYSRFGFAKPGNYRVVAAGSPGVIVKIDGKVVIQYLDTHVPVPRDQVPYSASFEASDETTMVVRLIRDREPAAPLTLYFIDDTGNIADPVVFHELPE